MDKPNPELKPSVNLLWLGIALSVAYWLFESFMHAFVWHTGSLVESLLAQGEDGELEMRMVITALLVGSGWFGHRMLLRQIEANKTISRLNRLLNLSSFINQKVTRSKDIKPLFDDVCRAAVEVGGFNFAWIGRYNNPKDTLEAISVASFDEQCLHDVEAAGLRKNGAHCHMALEAAAGGKPTTCSTLQAHDCKAAWREPLLQHGCFSAAAFPISMEKERFGALVVYASVEGFFHEQEINILADAAGDISYTLTKVRMEEERTLAAGEIQKRVEELERFQKATVEREFRIKELRDELERVQKPKGSNPKSKP